jgi:HAD superfamily hydrolase (TIGR01549 family)
MNYHAFFFDFDGVIADSVDIKTKAFGKLFEKYGPEIQGKVVVHHLKNGGMPRVEKFKHYFNDFLNQKLDEKELEKLCRDFSSLVVDAVVAAPEITGVLDFILKWQKTVSCFVISATPDTELKEIIQRKKMAKYFLQTLGSSQSKTDNLMFLLKQHNINPEKCIFFGDSPNDYEAACACNVPFIGIIKNEGSGLFKVSAKIKWIRDFENLNIMNILKTNIKHISKEGNYCNEKDYC